MEFKKMLEEARADFAAGMNWMDFSNKYFGIGNPYIPEDKKKRKEFLASPEYEEIQAMKGKLAENQLDVTEPEKNYSGAISLRVPKSLHRFLVEEADQEGVSLNQLILAKISASLYDQLRGRR
jgi:predicted HicB family RNase H-like nuclease